MLSFQFAGKDNETDCIGRLTESIWMRSAGTAHPRAWKTPEDVQPDLLQTLRVPHIDGEMCKPPDTSAPHERTTSSKLLLANSVTARLETTNAGRSLSHNGVVADMRAYLQMASTKNYLRQSDGRVQKRNTGSAPAIVDLVDALRELNPLPSSCPLFARKFDAATALAVANAYSKSILT